MNASIFENKIHKLLREEKECRLSGGLYHCPRIVPVIEAMTAITLADLLLQNRAARR